MTLPLSVLSPEEIEESEALAKNMYRRGGGGGGEDRDVREKAVKITKTRIIRSRKKNAGKKIKTAAGLAAHGL